MYEEIQLKFPLEFALRDQDKYRYRYPKGEVSLHEISFLLISAFAIYIIARCILAFVFYHSVFVLFFYVPLATKSFSSCFNTLNTHQINVAGC